MLAEPAICLTIVDLNASWFRSGITPQESISRARDEQAAAGSKMALQQHNTGRVADRRAGAIR
jgi:hypothetical protein